MTHDTLLSLYHRLPRSLQAVAVNVKGIEYRLRRASSRRIHSSADFLERSQWWSRTEHLDYQSEKLVAHLRRCVESVPYYRNRPVYRDLATRRTLTCTDIEHLPILDKAEVLAHWAEFCSEAYSRLSSIPIMTSGTTGTPLTCLETRRSFSDRMAFVVRLRRWAGLSDPFTPRKVQFTGREIASPRRSGNTKFWHVNLAGNALLMSPFFVDFQTVEQYLSAMSRFDPLLVEGYPSSIALLARLGLESGCRFPRPGAVICTAETLHDDDRESIEAAFDCRVFNQYASSEPSCFWCECEEGRMHVNPEYGISEILGDDRFPAGPGQEGRVVVTSVLNDVFPLIRYKTGDRAVPSQTQGCECGRDMPTVDEVLGREDDVLYIPGTGFVGRLAGLFKGVRGLVEAQVVQVEPRRLVVNIVPSPSARWTDVVDQVERRLRMRVLALEATYNRMDAIPRAANGKFRAVVSEIAPKLGQSQTNGSRSGRTADAALDYRKTSGNDESQSRPSDVRARDQI